MIKERVLNPKLAKQFLLTIGLVILKGKNFLKNLIQEFVKIETWLLLFIVYITNDIFIIPLRYDCKAL